MGMTKTEELEMMRRLRAVLKRSSRGLGIAGSFVSVFVGSKQEMEREAVRRILLGTPVGPAFAGLMSETSATGDLLKFIAAQAKVSALEASRGAERLSALFERWTHLKEKRVMERKVMEFRGLVISTVAGVVVGMLSTLAPLISDFQLSLGAAGDRLRAGRQDAEDKRIPRRCRAGTLRGHRQAHGGHRGRRHRKAAGRGGPLENGLRRRRQLH